MAGVCAIAEGLRMYRAPLRLISSTLYKRVASAQRLCGPGAHFGRGTGATAKTFGSLKAGARKAAIELSPPEKAPVLSCPERVAAAVHGTWRGLSTGSPVIGQPLSGVSSLAGKVIVGIDPDLGGALAALTLDAHCLAGDAEGGPGWCPAEMAVIPMVGDTHMTQALVDALGAMQPVVHDTPCVKVKVGKTLRRRPDVDEVVGIAREITQLAGGREVIVCIEQPRPQPTNGAMSSYAVGLCFGVWCGVMHSHGFQVVAIEPTQWKKDMDLWRRDKESSRELALKLFPQASDMMRRKKDHGRAEALLISVWAVWTALRLKRTPK